MKEKARGIIVFSIIVLIIDQLIKAVLDSKMIVGQTVVVTKNFFSITLVHNIGAAFNILSGNKFLLIGIGLIATIFLVIYIFKLEVIDDFDIFTYSLLLGGIIGNLVDRIFRGYVVDYFSFNFGSYYFPVFNFADVCIVLSIICIFINTLKGDLWK